MAFRIGKHILGGFLSNKRRNRVHGWLAYDEGVGIHFEFIGNLAGDLAGRVVEFEVLGREPSAKDVIDAELDGLIHSQIGAAGDMLLRMVRVPDCPVEELMRRAKLGDLPPMDEKPCLYLEWFSQNGRVVAEIVGVEVRDYVEEGRPRPEVTPIPLPDPDDVGLGITGIAIDEAGRAQSFEFGPDDAEPDDPFGLFPDDLDAAVSRSADSESDVASGDPPQPRSWDEVIPGIDPETKALYEQWDEIYGGTKDEFLSTLIDPPLQLPPPDEVTDEDVARSLVMQIAASLARLSVAFDLCDHFTMVRTYRWLIEEILVEGHVHPGQTPTGIVTHYSTWESCPECDAEFGVEYARRHGKPG
jgi:hypothetical protein